MFEWAVNALMVTCRRLERWYGRDTCRVTWTKGNEQVLKPKAISKKFSTIDMKVVSLVFVPRKRQRRGKVAVAPCPCEDVDR